MAVIPPDWWAEVSPLLDEALELDPEAREAWLLALRVSRPDTAARVASLLQEHEDLVNARFLEGSLSTPLDIHGKGASVGPYRLLSLIGEGGMGTVWLAERTDGELRQRVAVKLLGGIESRPGWRERFLRERQLLASLSHPAIVRVMDAGHTVDGRPYLIMEFVEGRPIDAYAEGRPLDDRLELFLRVCDAVAHAHRHLIVHRDLKPSNILVEAAGSPKLLDFGLAKLLDETGDVTHTLDRLLTPAYASPEQVTGSSQTTATDVYSLGAVLYRLLAGRSPHATADGTARAMAARAGAPDIPPPSRLDPTLPSDLDYIVGMALRKEPDDRYASVEALAADVRRLLAHEPVEARAGDSWYRARKFVRRNQVPIAAAAAVIVSLSAGLYYANRQRTRAQRRFKQVRELATRFIALDQEIRDLPGATKARTRIVAEALDYLASLGAEADTDQELLLEIATAYMQIARVQGVPIGQNLGHYEQAVASLDDAMRYVQRILEASPGHAPTLLVAAQVERDQMAIHDYQGRPDNALTHADAAARYLDAFLQAGQPSDADVNTVCHIYSNIGVFHSNTGRLEQTIAFAERAVEISTGVASARMRRASALGVMAVALRRTGDLDAAAHAADEASSVLEAVVAVDGTWVSRFNRSNALLRQAAVLGGVDGPNLDRPTEAIALIERALADAEVMANADPNDSQVRTNIANLCRDLGDILCEREPQQALRIYEQGLRRIREGHANARTQHEEAGLLAASSHALRRLGRGDDARASIAQAFALVRTLGVYPTDTIEPFADTDAVLRAQAEQHIADGDLVEAERTYDEQLKGLYAASSPETDLRDATRIASVLTARAEVARVRGEKHKAEALSQQCLRLWESWASRKPGNAFVRRQLNAAGDTSLLRGAEG